MGTRLKIKDNETACKIYYTTDVIGTAEIRELFGCKSGAARLRLKEAQQEELKRHSKLYSDHYVSTDIAYEAWGLDIASITKKVERYRKLKGGQK